MSRTPIMIHENKSFIKILVRGSEWLAKLTGVQQSSE